jgi:hypothetical protein
VVNNNFHYPQFQTDPLVNYELACRAGWLALIIITLLVKIDDEPLSSYESGTMAAEEKGKRKGCFKK